MERREFVAVVVWGVGGTGAGCLSADEPAPEIARLELENHQREERHEFSVHIEDDETTIFDETHLLGPAGSGNEALTFEHPVEPGTYTVHVEADAFSATADTQTLISDGKTCLRLQFYLSPATLHMEHQLYDRCE